MGIVNIRTHLFLIETKTSNIMCSKIGFDFGKYVFFLLTFKRICFTHTPNKIPLRGHIPGADFAMIKKNEGWKP